MCMYTNHFNFRLKPFDNGSGSDFIFDQENYALIRNHITESLKKARGLIVFTGPKGSGKKTLVKMALSNLPYGIKLIKMDDLPDSKMDFFEFVAGELGLAPSTPITSTMEKVIIVKYINGALQKIHSQGGKCVLIIDRAHLISNNIINGIRLLKDFEEDSNKLILIILLGPDELMEKINMPEMEVLKQHIEICEVVDKIDADNIQNYILHRIKVAGGQQCIFTDEGWRALESVFSSGSTPHAVNSLCDKALNAAFARKSRSVDGEDVLEAARGMKVAGNVFHEMEVPEQSENEKKVNSSREDDLNIEPEAPDKSDVSTHESCDTNKDQGKRQAEALSITETDQKGFRNSLNTYLQRVLLKKEKRLAKAKEFFISLDEKKIKLSENKDRAIQEPERTDPSSEWVTVDTKGVKSFEPVGVKNERLPDKNITEVKVDNWVHTGLEKPDGIPPSYEWVNMDGNREKRLNAGDVTHKG